jgi:hypothetical protein
MPTIRERYTAHDHMTEPGTFGSLYDHLPSDVSALRKLVSQLIVHVSLADKYEIPATMARPRETQSASDRLRLIQATLNEPLDVPRPPHQRTFGTCRDYSLLLCSMLRHQAIPARIRCGFANYFSAAPYQDHWICEYWSEREQRWYRVDAQLDEMQAHELGIAFNPSDLPNDVYLTAGQAWILVRNGGALADEFGHGDDRGLWFLNVNLHRDLLALTNQQTSIWDTWRTATPGTKLVDMSGKAFGDEIAAEIVRADSTSDALSQLFELAALAMPPPWIASR